MCRLYEASVFETTIRVVGGILTAHELTGDPEFLKRQAPLSPIVWHDTSDFTSMQGLAGTAEYGQCGGRGGWTSLC